MSEQNKIQYRPITVKFTDYLYYSDWHDISDVEERMMERNCQLEISGFIVSEDPEKIAVAGMANDRGRVNGFRLIPKASILYRSDSQQNPNQQPTNLNQDVQSPNHNTGGFFKPE